MIILLQTSGCSLQSTSLAAAPTGEVLSWWMVNKYAELVILEIVQCSLYAIIWQGVQQLHVPRVAGEHGAGRHPRHHLRLHLRPGRAPARCPGGGRGGGGARADRAACQDQEVRHWQWHSSCSGPFNKMHAQSINEIFHNWAKHFDYICYHW